METLAASYRDQCHVPKTHLFHVTFLIAGYLLAIRSPRASHAGEADFSCLSAAIRAVDPNCSRKQQNTYFCSLLARLNDFLSDQEHHIIQRELSYSKEILLCSGRNRNAQSEPLMCL